MKTRICPGTRTESCGRLTTLPKGRCESHATFGDLFRPSRSPSPVYHTTKWRKLRKRVIDEWLAEHGWVCPGWRVRRHPTRSFSVDHIVPLVAGGAAFDRTNLRVLCRSCNSRKSLWDRRAR